MRFTTFIAAVGAFVCLSAAVPMQQQLDKRDIFWVTHTNIDIVTVPMTTTVWVTAGQQEIQPTETAQVQQPHQGHHNHHKNHDPITSHLTSTLTVQPTGSPATSAPEVPASTPQTTAPAPVVPTTTAAVVPTTPATTVLPNTPATTPTTAQPAPTTSTASTGGSGSTTGEITYYTPGMGSCGITSDSSESIVAMPVSIMTAALAASGSGNPNDNPLCGKMITLTSGSTSVTAKIVDTCPGCAADHIDTASAVFEQFGDLSLGVIQGISWTVPEY